MYGFPGKNPATLLDSSQSLSAGLAGDLCKGRVGVAKARGVPSTTEKQIDFRGEPKAF
jgi:hypothetical protein